MRLSSHVSQEKELAQTQREDRKLEEIMDRESRRLIRTYESQDLPAYVVARGSEKENHSEMMALYHKSSYLSHLSSSINDIESLDNSEDRSCSGNFITFEGLPNND